MVGFFRKKNRNSVSLGNGGKSSSSPALVNNNEYILYSSTELPNYDQFHHNHHSSKSGNSLGSNDKSITTTSSSSGGGQNSYGGVSFGNDNSNNGAGNSSPVTPPSPRHHINGHHHININGGGGNSNSNSFSKKSINSNKDIRNSIGSSGSRDNLMTPPPTTTSVSSSSQPVSSYSEKDVFPNGVKRALKGIMLMGEGNDDVLTRARTYISHNGDIHFTQEDLPQYMLPEDYEEELYQPLQLKLPYIKPLSTHGFDSDTDDSDKEINSDDKDDLYFDDEIQKRSNWANGLSNWTPKSPVQVSQQFIETPLLNLRHLIYEEDKSLDDEDDNNKFVIPKEEVEKLFLNENNDDGDDEMDEEEFKNDNNSSTSSGDLDYNVEDVDVEFTKDDIRTSDPIIINNNNNMNNSKDDEILTVLNQTIRLSSNLSSNNLIINSINNNIGSNLVNQLPPFNRNSSSTSISSGSPSPYKVSSKLPSQVSTISKSILKDLDSSDNDILQSLEMVIDSPQKISSSSNRIQSMKCEQMSTENVEQPTNEQELSLPSIQSPLKLNRESGKFDILGGFEDILNQSFKNARKSILFEKKLLDSSTTPNNSTNDLTIFKQQSIHVTSPPPLLSIESPRTFASDLEKSILNHTELQSSYSGLEKLRIDIQNLDISSNIANFDNESKSNMDLEYFSGGSTTTLGIINNSTSFNNIDELEHDNDDSLSDITHDDSSDDSSHNNNKHLSKNILQVIKEEPFDESDNSSTFSSNDDSLPVLTGNGVTNHTISDSEEDNEEEEQTSELYEIDQVDEIGIKATNDNNENLIQNILNSIPNILINNDNNNNIENCIYFKENENPYDIYSPPSSTDEIDYENYSHISSVRGLSFKRDSLLSINTSIGRTLSNISSELSDQSINSSNNNSQRQRSNSKSSYNSSLSELSELLISLERKKPIVSTIQEPIINSYNYDEDNDEEEEVELKINKTVNNKISIKNI